MRIRSDKRVGGASGKLEATDAFFSAIAKLIFLSGVEKRASGWRKIDEKKYHNNKQNVISNDCNRSGKICETLNIVTFPPR